MKVSFWHQFSSNHSGSYRIIGTFASHTLAQHAYTTLNELMLKIIELNRPPERSNNFAPTQVEIEYGHKYGIEWGESILWLRPDSIDETPFQFIIDDYVSQFGENIAIDSGGDSAR